MGERIPRLVRDFMPWRHEPSPLDRGTRSFAIKLALAGCQRSPTLFQDGRLPYCDSPVHIVRASRASEEMGTQSLQAEMYGPCRRCPKCLQFRQMKWRERALAEIQAWPRTWFVTLTFSPEHLAGVLQEAALMSSPEATEARVERAAFGHVQRYLKRLRKDGCDFRYLAVYERGEETGRSHYHLLVHEVKPLTKRHLERQWRSHVHARLVAEKARGAASYLTKYATKSIDIRPRASRYYGDLSHPKHPKQRLSYR